jgi:hypothetical protein
MRLSLKCGQDGYLPAPAAGAMIEVHGPHSGSHVTKVKPLTLCTAWAATIMTPSAAHKVPRQRVIGGEDRTMSLEHPYME